MAKIVTFRVLVEDNAAQALVDNCKSSLNNGALDIAVNIDQVPEILEDAIADKTYEEGDFKRPMHVMIHSDGPCYVKAHNLDNTTEHAEDAAEFFAWDLPEGMKPYHYLDYVN